MDLTVVIVNYRVRYFLEQTLRSVMEAVQGLAAEVIVIDNASGDGSLEFVRERLPECVYVENRENVGFARANNIGIRMARGEYTLILNPDTIICKRVIDDCLEWMRTHERCSAIGAHMVDGNGVFLPESKRAFTTPWVSFCKIFGLSSLFPRSRWFAKYHLRYLSEDEPHQVDVLSGAFMFCRTSLLQQVDGLDEDFFMYGEDIDLSYRLLKKGFQNWYLPTHILHYKGESTHKSSFRYVHVFYEAMLIFFRKHYGHMSFVVTLPIKAAIYGKATLELIGMVPSLIRDALGLRIRRHVKFPEYIFFGREHAINKCRRLARNKGVSAQFVVGDEQSIPNGHLDHLDLIQPGQTTYVVYDTDSFSYDSIFRIFSSRPMDNVYIGTYHPKDNLVITDKEVLKNGNY